MADRGIETSTHAGLLRPWLMCAAVCCVMLLVGMLLFPAAGRDDTHITCWPAYSLTHAGEMVNYNAERVEQSSSLLQVLLLALLTLVSGLDTVALSRLVSVMFGAGTIVAILVLVKRSASPTASLSAALLTALSAYFVYWSFGGLETTMVCFSGVCVIISVADYLADRSVNSLIRPAFAILLLLLTRPEAPLLLGGVLGCTLILIRLKAAFSAKAKATQKAFTVKLLVLLGICALMSCAILAFRLWYFKAVLPQPVFAKCTGLSLGIIQNGITYLTISLFGSNQAMSAVVLITIAAASVTFISELAAKEFNLYKLLSLIFCAAYLAFAVLSGGDWMEGGRFLVFFMPVAMTFIPLALTRLTGRVLPLVLVTTIIACLQAATIVEFACYSSTSMPLWATPVGKYDVSHFSWFERHNRINLRDAPVINHLDSIVTRLNASRKTPVIIMSGQMGATVYHLATKHQEKVRFLDRFALTDRTFTTCSTTRDLPRGRLGLQLWYEFYFSNLNSLTKIDQVPLPDIIFDIGSVPERLLAGNGYTIVYHQSGRVVSSSAWFPGRDVIANEFIAIRTDLLAMLGDPKPVIVEYGR